MKTYTVAVRSLCEFAAKQGDLDLRFTPSPSSQQGMEGHRVVLAGRGAGYRREVSVRGEYKQLIVRGRADGFDPERVLVEEVKTCSGDPERIAEIHRRLHWAQARVYGALLCRELGLSGIAVSLVYFDIREQRELPPLTEQRTAQELRVFFEALCDRFLVWAQSELKHRQTRDDVLAGLRFPYPSFRPGQRDLAKAVFNTARSGGCLLAQAPTGIGKTMATLFPLLKACPVQGIDKIFFLTAKRSGRALARAAIDALRTAEPGLRLRVLDLTAREQACEHPDKACHGESCPLAKGFYDRLPEARSAAIAAGSMTRAVLRETALAHSVCPYYLGQELVRWSDVVIADYNHYFDAGAVLHESMHADDWRVGILVDEAHNLVERARAMYSASLGVAQMRLRRAAIPLPVREALERARRTWQRIARNTSSRYTALDQPPPASVSALRRAADAIGEHLADSPASAGDELLEIYFHILAFSRLLDSFGSHSVFDVFAHEADSILSVRNIVPAHFLAARFVQPQSVVLFSATLTPWGFYSDCLGLPKATATLDVRSCFRPDKLMVRVVGNVSTRYRDRDRSLAPIASLIGSRLERSPGNYLAYLSSFEYVDRVFAEFTSRHPHIAAWKQERQMSEARREQFLQRFVTDGQGVGFAVLGGTFGEGIDLVGTQLIGVFIATLGLPQVNEVNEEMRRRLERLFGAGYDYAYLFPGIRKVVQAAGRVIRTESDSGSVHLIDDRFTRPQILRLLPRWWRIRVIRGDVGDAGRKGLDRPRNGLEGSTLS